MTELETTCVRRIAEAKVVPVESVALDTTLESLAVDSLDLATLSFDLEEEYGVDIPQAQLGTIRTVGDVAAAIQQAIEKKASATPRAADLP